MALACTNSMMDWQLSKESVMDRMQVLLKTSQWSDCTFRVEGEIDVQVFEAHRLLLAAASPVFEAMYFGPLAEKACVIISDIEPVVFKILLEYVYTDKVRLSSCEEAAGVMYAAKKYMLPALSAACREYLAAHLRPSNALGLFDFADEMEEAELQEACVKVLARQPSEALRAAKPSGAALRALAEQEALNLPEEELWRAALGWAGSEAEGVRGALERAGLLARVRLLALPAGAFSEALRCGVLRPHEALALQRARRALDGSGGGDAEPLSSSSSSSLAAAGALALPPVSSVPASLPFLPEGLCAETRARARVPLAQFFCVRRFLKTAVTVSGRVRLLANVRADRSVVVSGVRVFTRLVPPAADARNRLPTAQLPAPAPASAPVAATTPAADSDGGHDTQSPPPPLKYNEDLQVSVVDAGGAVLSRTRFRDAVEYNTLATVPLGEAVRLRAGEEYGFLFELPSSSSQHQQSSSQHHYSAPPPSGPFEYPLGFMAQRERTRDIEFRFCDHADVGATGVFVRRLDMGYVDALVYSL